MDHEFHWYRYIDDTDDCWLIKVSDFLAEVSGLERIAPEAMNQFQFMGGNYKPRHIKLVAFDERPGVAKYRVDVITNERDHSKLLDQEYVVHGMRMRCVRYVGEQRTG
jgi:hypothetical protein